MRELTDEYSLWHVGGLYPHASKVTIDDEGRTAYVFVGRGNRATVVTGAEFDKLVKALPAAEPAATAGADEGLHAVEPVEAVIAVVEEPARPRGRKEKG